MGPPTKKRLTPPLTITVHAAAVSFRLHQWTLRNRFAFTGRWNRTLMTNRVRVRAAATGRRGLTKNEVLKIALGVRARAASSRLSQPGRARTQSRGTIYQSERRTEITGHRRGPDRPCATLIIVITIMITVRVIIIKNNSTKTTKQYKRPSFSVYYYCYYSCSVAADSARPSVPARTHAATARAPEVCVRSTFQIIEGRLLRRVSPRHR